MPLSRPAQGLDAFDHQRQPLARSSQGRFAFDRSQSEKPGATHSPRVNQASIRPRLSHLAVDRAIATLNDWNPIPEAWVNLLAIDQAEMDPAGIDRLHRSWNKTPRHAFDGTKQAPSKSQPTHRSPVYTCNVDFPCPLELDESESNYLGFSNLTHDNLKRHGYFDRDDLEHELNQLLHRSRVGNKESTHPELPVGSREPRYDANPLHLDEQFDRIEAWLASVEIETRPVSPAANPTAAAKYSMVSRNTIPSAPPNRHRATAQPESEAWCMLIQTSYVGPASEASSQTWIVTLETEARTAKAGTTHQGSDADRHHGSWSAPLLVMPSHPSAAAEIPGDLGVEGILPSKPSKRGLPYPEMIAPFRDCDPAALNIVQKTEPSRTQRECEAPAELALLRLCRSVALPTDELNGNLMQTCIERCGDPPKPLQILPDLRTTPRRRSNSRASVRPKKTHVCLQLA